WAWRGGREYSAGPAPAAPSRRAGLPPAGSRRGKSPPAERGLIRPVGVSGNLEGRGPVDVIFSACLLAIHELNYPRPVPEVGVKRVAATTEVTAVLLRRVKPTTDGHGGFQVSRWSHDGGSLGLVQPTPPGILPPC